MDSQLKSIIDDFLKQLSRFSYLKLNIEKITDFISKSETSVIVQSLSSLPDEITLKIFKKNSKVSIFGDFLPLNIFNNESRKTKETLIKHLQLLKIFNRLSTPKFQISQQPPQITNLLSEMPKGLDTIVKNIANVMHEKKIDTGNLLATILSGNIDKNSELSDLLNTVKEEVDSQIQKGNLTETSLTDYTNTFLSNAGLHK